MTCCVYGAPRRIRQSESARAAIGKTPIRNPKSEIRNKDPVYIRAPAYLLLEVVVALGLLVLGLATIGMQVQQSVDTSRDMHRMLRAMNLAESKLAELDAGLIPDVQSAVETDLEEEFGRLFPQYAWRLRIEPTPTADLWLIRLQILYQDRRNADDEFDFEEAEELYSLRTLRATPARVNLQRDFGVDDETMEKIREATAGTDFDPGDYNPGDLVKMPLDQLVELLAAFEDAGLLAGLDLESVLPPDVWEMLQDALGSDEDDGENDNSEEGSGDEAADPDAEGGG